MEIDFKYLHGDRILIRGKILETFIEDSPTKYKINTIENETKIVGMSEEENKYIIYEFYDISDRPDKEVLYEIEKDPNKEFRTIQKV